MLNLDQVTVAPHVGKDLLDLLAVSDQDNPVVFIQNRAGFDGTSDYNFSPAVTTHYIHADSHVVLALLANFQAKAGSNISAVAACSMRKFGLIASGTVSVIHRFNSVMAPAFTRPGTTNFLFWQHNQHIRC